MSRIAYFALVAIAVAICANAQTGCPAVAVAGSTFVCTSASSVTWSVSGDGVSCTPSSGTSTTCSVPAGLVAANNELGCPATPNDSLFNVDYSGAPINSNSSTIVAALQRPGFVGLQFLPGWGISLATSATPISSWKNLYDHSTVSTPMPTGSMQLNKESGNQEFISGWKANANAQQPDEHVLTVRNSDCSFWDVYDPFFPGAHIGGFGATTLCSDGVTTGCTSVSSGGYSNWSTNPYLLIAPDGTTAAGTPLGPLTLHPDDIKGHILNHAIEITYQDSARAAGLFLRPATATVNGCTNTCSPAPAYDSHGLPTNYAVYGSMFLLPSSFAATGVCGSDSAATSTSCSIAGICTGLTTLQNTMCSNLLTGLQHHPIVLVDATSGGTQNSIIYALEGEGDHDFMIVLAHIQAAAISSTNYQVIDTVASGVAQDTATYQATAQGSAGYSGTLGGITYYGATQSSIRTTSRVTVTGGATAYNVAIQPVTMGSNWPLATQGVLSGSGARPIPYWVNPSTVSQAVTPSISSGCGTVGGTSTAPTYTPPTNGTLISGCSLTLTSTYDSAATLTFYFPVVPSASGALRIDSGLASGTSTDGLGNVWQADTYPQFIPSSASPNAGAHWQNSVYSAQYQTSDLASGGAESDIRYWLLVAPSTNYSVHLLLGMPDGICTYPCGTWPGPLHSWYTLTFAPVNIEINGVPMGHYYDWSYQSNYLYDTNADVTVPATSDAYGNLVISVQPLTPDVAYVGGGFNFTTPYTGPNLVPPANNKNNSLSGVEIVPFSGSPYLAIDPGLNTRQGLQIAPGTASQPFYAIAGYFSPGTVTWSASGPVCASLGCTVATDGWGDGGEIVTLGSGQVSSGQPITITASSGAYSATLTLYTQGSGYLVLP